MKKLLFFFVFLVANNLYSQTTYIPDNIFEQKLIDLGYDDIMDDYVVTSNISAIETLIITNEGGSVNNAITNLTGIEDFTSLVYLNVYGNRLTSLDLSNNLNLVEINCNHNKVMSKLILPSSGPDGSDSPLQTLSASHNKISEIDLTNSPRLEWFVFQSNLLTQIHFQCNKLLELVYLADNNLSEINICNNPLLTQFNIDGNNNISELDISNNPLIAYLYGHTTNISCVQVSDLDNPYLDDPYIYPHYWFNEGVQFSLDCGFENDCSSLSWDTDGDSIGNVCDNCPLIVNADQLDTDSDGEGDVCDTDDDNDTILDDQDNCPLTANTDQLDTDSDGIGDVCDTDDDGDGIEDSQDNCPLVANTDQADWDSDGIGDVCGDPKPLFTENITFVKNVYPNPTDNELIVELKDNSKVEKVEFIDFSGKVITPNKVESNNSSIRINVSNIIEGIYLLNITTDKEVNKVKVVIER